MRITVELSLDKSVDWIKLNHDSIGYYIVNYTEDAWNVFSNLLFYNHSVYIMVTLYRFLSSLVVI